MMKQRDKSYKTLIVSIIGIVLAIIHLFPFYILLNNSFKTSKGIFTDFFGLPFGDTFTIQNYIKAFKELDFLTTFFNSLAITVIGALLILLCSSMTSWMLARTKTKTSTFIFFLFSLYILVPFQCVMLPLIKIMGNMGMLNRAGLIFMYVGFGCSTTILFLHGFTKNVPISIEEAAIIDGCNPFKVFFRITLPLMKPIVFTVTLLNVMWLWNDYLLPSLVLTEPSVQTIPLRTYAFFGKFMKKWDLAIPALIISMIPIMIFYAFAQKHIISGVTEGSVK